MKYHSGGKDMAIGGREEREETGELWALPSSDAKTQWLHFVSKNPFG